MHNKKDGFTLIEILIVMSLLAMAALATLGLQYILAQNRTVAVNNYLSVNAANLSTTNMIREIRTAQVSESGAYAIATAEDNELIFYSDLDYDNNTERIRYTLTDNQLERGIIEPVGTTYPIENEKVKILSDKVRNEGAPIFTYYNGDWPQDTLNNPLTTPATLSSIKLIKVYLKIGIDNNPANDYVLESYASIRMLKENL